MKPIVAPETEDGRRNLYSIIDNIAFVVAVGGVAALYLGFVSVSFSQMFTGGIAIGVSLPIGILASFLAWRRRRSSRRAQTLLGEG
jgi:hypothetical protein